MEKPVINLRTGINFLRYHYFFGNQFYFMISSQYCLFFCLIFEILNYTFNILPSIVIAWRYLIYCGVFSLITIFILTLFFKVSKKIMGISILISNVLGATLFSGLNLLMNWGSNISLGIVGLLLICLVFSIYSYFESTTGRINIFPNRITFKKTGMKKLIIYYKDMIKVRWISGSIEENMKPEWKNKNPEVLTPIKLYEEIDNFTIYYHSIMIELENKIYFMQPETNRDSFVQNVRNGWLETWRWNGNKKMPEGWEKPEGSPY